MMKHGDICGSGAGEADYIFVDDDYVYILNDCIFSCPRFSSIYIYMAETSP